MLKGRKKKGGMGELERETVREREREGEREEGGRERERERERERIERERDFSSIVIFKHNLLEVAKTMKKGRNSVSC